MLFRSRYLSDMPFRAIRVGLPVLIAFARFTCAPDSKNVIGNVDVVRPNGRRFNNAFRLGNFALIERSNGSDTITDRRSAVAKILQGLMDGLPSRDLFTHLLGVINASSHLLVTILTSNSAGRTLHSNLWHISRVIIGRRGLFRRLVESRFLRGFD